MTLETLKQQIEAGFADAEKLLGFVNEAVPFIEAAVPQDAAEIQAAQNAANKLTPLVTGLLEGGNIDQPTHDDLQKRVALAGSAAATQAAANPPLATPDPDIEKNTTQPD